MLSFVIILHKNYVGSIYDELVHYFQQLILRRTKKPLTKHTLKHHFDNKHL